MDAEGKYRAQAVDKSSVCDIIEAESAAMQREEA